MIKSPDRPGRFDVVGLGLGLLALVGLTLVMLEPDVLVTGVTSGLAFLPVVGESRWLTPIALSTFGLAVMFVIREVTARRPLLAWREWADLGRETDLRGALMLTVGLGAIIVAFASAEPESSAISPSAPWLLPLAAIAFAGFWWRQRTAPRPLVPRGALGSRPAWGALVVSFFIGASLIAALVDIPFFARLTVHRDSQLDAALVLLRFLIALPVGAVLGGWLLRRVPAHVLTAAAMLLSAVAFAHMATWDAESLKHQSETFSLVLGGLGFGLAIAPVNAALLEHTDGPVHGVASALLIVARMVGMLLGISALTTIGLHAFYDASAAIPPAAELCDGAATACQAYRDAVRDAGIVQLHAVFVGAAACASAAAVLALGTPAPDIGSGHGRDPRPALTRLSPMDDFDDLLAANREFAGQFTLSGFDGVAHAGVAMVTCMDSRIDPLGMIGLAPGDAKILRNPGGRVTDQVLVALVLGVNLLKVDRILVVEHTRCAMASASEDELRGQSRRQRRYGRVVDVARSHRGPEGDRARRRRESARAPADRRPRARRRLPLRRRLRAARPGHLTLGSTSDEHCRTGL